MSVGLYRHASLGETRKYILNNKHVLEVKVDLKQTEDWFQQYTNLKESLLRNQK
jgi:transcription initiation factor TFIID subunit TAF12